MGSIPTTRPLILIVLVEISKTENASMTENQKHPKEWCVETKASNQKEIFKLRTKELAFSLYRLASFFLLGIGPYFAINLDHPIKSIFWLSLPIGSIAFYIFVRKHQNVKDSIYFLSNTNNAIDLTLQSLSDNQFTPVSHQSKDSPIYPDAEHWKLTEQETDDLDFYSEGASLFGKINRTYSTKGRQILSGLLSAPLLNKNPIDERAKAYANLEKNPAFLHLMAGNAKDFSNLQEQFLNLKLALNSEINLRGSGLSKFSLGYTFLPLIFLVILLQGYIHQKYFVFLGLIILANIIFTKIIEKRVFPLLKPWLSISSLLNYSELFLQKATAIEYTHEPLKSLAAKSKILIEDSNLPALKSSVSLIRLRYSGVIHMIVDTLFFWDIRVMCHLEKVLKNQSSFENLEEIIGEWEAHISMALQNYVNFDGTYAEILDKKEFSIIDGTHPLLPANAVIGNSIQLQPSDRAWVISGSNMSGKSTFLRMVGINSLFGQVGLKTYSKKTYMCPLRIMTDLRIRDNLYKNESYFLAEVKQLKRMIDLSTGEPVVLGIIDEPYRGTNSDERVAASLEVLRFLLSSGGFFLTATHDKEVTQLVGEINDVSNHHFQETLNDKDISFDYLIRDGIATTRNAIKVLEQEGYPAEIIQRAEALLEKNNKNAREF
ncbi:MAG: hypothetical protein COA79_12065 [Planctomycetota bacterium]|nr:MAG: hypothetical protein COA79_12065 [Planctomycetota bacterium]